MREVITTTRPTTTTTTTERAHITIPRSFSEFRENLLFPSNSHYGHTPGQSREDMTSYTPRHKKLKDDKKMQKLRWMFDRSGRTARHVTFQQQPDGDGSHLKKVEDISCQPNCALSGGGGGSGLESLKRLKRHSEWQPLRRNSTSSTVRFLKRY